MLMRSNIIKYGMKLIKQTSSPSYMTAHKQVRDYCQTRYNTSFGLYEKVDFLTFFNFLAATQKVACYMYRFLHIFMESEQTYFRQNLGEKWPATMVNKQLFFDPKLAQTTCFPYNMPGIQDIKLSENKFQYIIS